MIGKKRSYTYPWHISPYQHIIFDRLSAIKGKKKKPLKILDAGTGSGIMPFYYAKLLHDDRRFSNFKVIGIDNYEDNILIAQSFHENPDYLADYFRKNAKKQKIDIDDDIFLKSWMNELNTFRPEYFNNISFKHGDAEDKDFIESIGKIDVILFNECLLDLSENAYNNILDIWNKDGSIMMRTLEPLKYKKEITEHTGVPLTFITFDKHLTEVSYYYSYVAHELVLAVPTSILSISDKTKSCVFDMYDYDNHVFFTDGVYELDNCICKDTYSQNIHQFFIDNVLPICLNRPISDGVGRMYMPRNEQGSGTYGIRIETDDTKEDPDVMSFREKGVNIVFHKGEDSQSSNKPNYYEIYKFSDEVKQIIPIVNQVINDIYFLKNVKSEIKMKTPKKSFW
ncbi:MAG: hypothetical protein KAS90_01740 [Candidatus Aenigmarchaeota archaeon]|nr:hypothetical protein [Candidatus Aenigmarchaeota archaeon]